MAEVRKNETKGCKVQYQAILELLVYLKMHIMSQYWPDNPGTPLGDYKYRKYTFINTFVHTIVAVRIIYIRTFQNLIGRILTRDKPHARTLNIYDPHSCAE